MLSIFLIPAADLLSGPNGQKSETCWAVWTAMIILFSVLSGLLVGGIDRNPRLQALGLDPISVNMEGKSAFRIFNSPFLPHHHGRSCGPLMPCMIPLPLGG